MSLVFKGTVAYELAVNALRSELNFLDETNVLNVMRFNLKVIQTLGPGDHWLLRRVEGNMRELLK